MTALSELSTRCHDVVPPKQATRNMSQEGINRAQPLFDRPVVKRVTNTLRPLLENALDAFGSMPTSVEDQQRFISANIKKLQNWLHVNLTMIQDIQIQLDRPTP